MSQSCWHREGCSEKPPSTADEKAIHAAELAWASDCSTGNLDKVLTHYADNARVKISGLPIMNSRNSIRLGLATLLNDPGDLTFTPEGRADNLLKTRIGTFSVFPGPRSQTGVYVTGFVKLADGRWLIDQQTFTPLFAHPRRFFDPIPGGNAG